MFIFKNYTITNQNQSDLLEQDSKYNTDISVFNNTVINECVIEIIQGEMRFRNHVPSNIKKQCDGATISFSEPNREDYGEQNINISYTYKSDRVPTYKFNSSLISDSYSSTSDLFKAVEQNTHFNTKVNVPVNRLGDYRVTVNAYDAWNNTFTNKSDDICKVTTKRMSIDMIINQDYSDNMTDFYRENKTIDASNPTTGDSFYTTDTSYVSIKNKMDTFPKFPIAYKIYDASHINDDNTISYNNISYAIDTPKANDYIIVTNMTERVETISVSDSSTTLIMNENNPNKQNLFTNVSNKKVMLCIYNDNTQEIIAALDEPTNVTTTNENTLTVSITENIFNNALNDNIDNINSHKYNINLYVINATDINIDTTYDIDNYVETLDGSVFRYAFVPTDIIDSSNNETYVFNPDTVVKVCTKSNDEDDEMFNNQTAYRVLDTSVITLNEEQKIVGYVLDGNIDINKIKSRYSLNKFNKNEEIGIDSSTYKYTHNDIEFFISPLHSQPVLYTLRVNEDAAENVFVYGDFEYYSMMTTVQYNPLLLLFDSYFDDSYAVITFKFDPIDLKNIWVDLTSIQSDDNNKYRLYRFTDFPITVSQNRTLIVVPNVPIDENTNKPIIEENSQYKTLWKWKTYAIEERSNWKEQRNKYGQLLLFESSNEILTVSPKMLGS